MAKTHGKSGGSLYSIWTSMKQRCFNPNCPTFGYYGGRGITVCDRWTDSFENFMEDVGEPPFVGAQLDRVDNNGSYEPNNVRWVSARENTLNRRPPSEWGKDAHAKKDTNTTVFSIRIPKALMADVKELASQEHRSTNFTINVLLESALVLSKEKNLFTWG